MVCLAQTFARDLTQIKTSLQIAHDSDAVMRDKKTGDQLNKLAQKAYLGVGTLQVSSIHDPCISIVYGKYNAGRAVNDAMLKRMAEAMVSGRCLAETNPVVVAVDGARVISKSLADKYENNLSKLPGVLFSEGNFEVYVLDGMHRFKAAKMASTHLRKSHREAEVGIKTELGSRKPDKDKVCALRSWKASLGDIIELVEMWPVHFYDCSESPLPAQSLAYAHAGKRET